MAKVTIAYKLTVHRGARAGLVREYLPTAVDGLDRARRNANRFADKLDLDYGAICASVQPIYDTVEATGTQPDPRAAALVAECAAITEHFDDYQLGDL